MKFLVDAQLPPRLCLLFREKGVDAVHVSETEGGLTSTDTSLWKLAGGAQAIIDKDSDFVERLLVLGPPPQVLHIDVGNCSNRELLVTLESFWLEIERHLVGGARLVSVGTGRLEIVG